LVKGNSQNRNRNIAVLCAAQVRWLKIEALLTFADLGNKTTQDGSGTLIRNGLKHPPTKEAHCGVCILYIMYAKEHLLTIQCRFLPHVIRDTPSTGATQLHDISTFFYPPMP